MRGRIPSEHRFCDADRDTLAEVLADGQLAQRVAIRARVLLALDRGERSGVISHWLGLSRTGLWHLWQRYRRRGTAAIFDAPRSGRPPIFSPLATGPDRTDGLHRPGRLWSAPGPLGLP